MQVRALRVGLGQQGRREAQTVPGVQKLSVESGEENERREQVMSKTETKPTQTVQIKAPNLQVASFGIIGQTPLVIHRFSVKAAEQIKQKMLTGAQSKKGKAREPADLTAIYEAARYRSREGWDGFNAACIRAAMISACRLVGFKMTLAKLSLFVIEEGRDKLEPQIPLIRIHGEPHPLEMIARVETGQPYLCVRAMYETWKATIRIRFDADQFSVSDISNLLMRVGMQVGIGEGRADSPNSAGMGWGSFTLEDGKK